MTKLVLCPVVVKTPALTDVLYKGQMYRVSFSGIFVSGVMYMTGSGGLISPEFTNRSF